MRSLHQSGPEGQRDKEIALSQFILSQFEGVGPFTKPPLLQEIRLTGGGSPGGGGGGGGGPRRVEGPCRVEFGSCKLFPLHFSTTVHLCCTNS